TLDVTLRKPRTADEYRNAIVEARGVCGHMRHLVERLLSLARLDAGVLQARMEPVDIHELTQDVAAVVRPLATEKGLQLTVECPPVLSWKTDVDKFREVLINLMHNAVQYNRPQGTIVLRVTNGAMGLKASVSDTGVGIKPEQMEHLFERFYRADPSREEAA